MGDEETEGPMSAEEFRSLTDGLVRQSSGGGTTVYKNAAGVGCPNPDCDRGVFQTLFVSDHGCSRSVRPVTESICASVTPSRSGSFSFTTSSGPLWQPPTAGDARADREPSQSSAVDSPPAFAAHRFGPSSNSIAAVSSGGDSTPRFAAMTAS